MLYHFDQIYTYSEIQENKVEMLEQQVRKLKKENQELRYENISQKNPGSSNIQKIESRPSVEVEKFDEGP